ncbi:uncharacterized protein LOC142220520 [Haematobia irritans]|uniref:uncharacterized protein LOC142220520 n=1 Tax=Haematobia irritans TaxID=7368 RepID=UPI003F4FAE6F
MTLVLKVNCRACNRECGDYKHLLDETLIDDESTTLAALLNYCTTIRCFDENDQFPLPEHICNSCVEHLLQAYLFKEMVLQNDRSLREHLKHELEETHRTEEEIVQEIHEDEVLESKIEDGYENNKQRAESECVYTEQEIDVGEEENLKSFFATSEINEVQQVQKTETSTNEFEDVVEYEMEEWLEIEDGTITTGIIEEEETTTREDDIKSEGDHVEENQIEEHQMQDVAESYIMAEETCQSESLDNLEEFHKENDQSQDEDEDEDGSQNTEDENKISRKKFVKPGGLTEEDLKCQYCGKQFDKMCRLREHTYIHTGHKPHECKICGKRSRTKTHYNVHMLTHDNTKRYRCNICGQHYRTSTSLRVHERKHADIRPYACTMCDKTFHTSEQKKLHVMIHTGERPYKCEKCGKSYRESHSLKQHMLTHGEKKPFECEICGKGLTQMSGYKRHILLHTNEYPYSCDICGRPFRISSNLVAHKRLHLDVLPYQCTLCGKGFNNTTRLKKHMAQHDQEPNKEVVFKPHKPRKETIIVDTKMCKSRVVEII